MRRWWWLPLLVGCAGARPPAPVPVAPLLAPAPEQVARTDVALSCGAALEILVPRSLPTISRTADEIVVASPRASLLVARGPRDVGADLRALAAALHLSEHDLSGPITVTHIAFAGDRLLADASIRGQAYQFARREDGACIAAGLAQRPASGDGLLAAIVGDIDAPPPIEAPARPTAIESFVQLVGGLLQLGCWLGGRC